MRVAPGRVALTIHNALWTGPIVPWGRGCPGTKAPQRMAFGSHLAPQGQWGTPQRCSPAGGLRATEGDERPTLPRDHRPCTLCPPRFLFVRLWPFAPRAGLGRGQSPP